jgi:hypothetical protein
LSLLGISFTFFRTGPPLLDKTTKVKASLLDLSYLFQALFHFFLSVKSTNQSTPPLGPALRPPVKVFSKAALFRVSSPALAFLLLQISAAFFRTGPLLLSGSTKRNASLVYTYSPKADSGHDGRSEEDVLAFPVQLILSPVSGKQNSFVTGE